MVRSAARRFGALPRNEGLGAGVATGPEDVAVSEQRRLARDSLFLTAEVRASSLEGDAIVRVRNLSAGGMMAEGALRVQRGQALQLNLRNIGWVEGTVAWVEGDRTGIAFASPIDPKKVRLPVGGGASAKAADPGPAMRKI
jgi:hypothetical protein